MDGTRRVTEGTEPVEGEEYIAGKDFWRGESEAQRRKEKGKKVTGKKGSYNEGGRGKRYRKSLAGRGGISEMFPPKNGNKNQGKKVRGEKKSIQGCR